MLTPLKGSGYGCTLHRPQTSFRIALLVFALILHGSVQAQELTPLGQRLRLFSSNLNRPLIGTLSSRTSDSTYIEVSRYHIRAIANRSIQRVEVSTARGTRAWTGAMIGAAAGALFISAYTLLDGRGSGTPAGVNALGVLLFAAPPALIGLGVGSAIRWEHWRAGRLALGDHAGPEASFRVAVKIPF